MNVLALEPWYGGSHRNFLDGLVKHSGHTFHRITMAARFWKWRMHGGAVTMARKAVQALGEGFVPEVIKRCHSGDILFPLLEFLVRSVDNITAMEFKRYDNRNYRHVRDASVFGKADPPLHDVVLGMLRFMLKHDLLNAGGPAQGIVAESSSIKEAGHV